MELNEMIWRVVGATGVSYEEAKKALEEHGNDMLNAVIALEREGKVQKRMDEMKDEKKEAETVTEEKVEAETESEKIEEETEKMEGDVINQDGKRAGTTAEKAARFSDSVKRLFKTLLDQQFQVERKGEEIIAVPVLVFILVLIFGFNIMIPLLIVGLFLGCHYHFLGAQKMTFDVNEMSRKASKYADDLKAEFKK